MTRPIRPPAVPPGATIHVAAPSGPVPAERFERGLRVLRRALTPSDLVVAGNVHDQAGYFAGDDDARLAGLRAALSDDGAGAIVCARGGYGATRLLGMLDPEQLRQRPKALVGFSDITALLCWALTRANVVGIHGPVVTQLATLPPDDVGRMVDLLRGEVPPPLVAEEGTVVRGGRVDGPLIVGNLEVLRSLVGTRYFPPLDGALLGLEDVGERPYRIDRALTQLIQSGALRGVRGIIVGSLVGCEEPDDGHVGGPSATEVVVERCETLGVPVVTGFPFGHDSTRNAALPFGVHATLDADICSLVIDEPVTAR